MRWGIIMLRGSIAPVVALLGGVLVDRYLGTLAQLSPGLARYGDMASVGCLVLALLLWAAFYWRLWKWQQGTADPCIRCGGPLGTLRDGKVYFGRQLSDFRRCYACGKANSDVPGSR